MLIERLINNRYFVWILLALPAIQFIEELIFPSGYYPEMMQRSGLLSVQLLVFVLCITPATLLLKPFSLGRAISRWLLAKRKYFGIASAGYALVHTVLYLRQISWDLELAWLEGLEWPFATGWVSLAAFIIVAAVSNSWGIAKLGKWWKPVQRLSYIAAIAAFAHWLLLDFFVHDAMQWIIPLAIAKVVHVGFRIVQNRATNRANAIG